MIAHLIDSAHDDEGPIADWGFGERWEPLVVVYRQDAALILASQPGVLPDWVSEYVVETLPVESVEA